jgi:cytochrome c-type biogenesis protein CcmH
MMLRLLAVLLLLSMPASAAVQPGERMADPALEARAETLYMQLRCVVCQSQPIAHSDSEIAAALRAAVRERLLKGDSDAAILDYMRERYGDAVLMKPPMRTRTGLLWFMPLLALIMGGFIVARTLRGKPA